MTVIRLRHVATINPPTPEFDVAPDGADVTFVPLEAVWPNALDVARTRPKGEVAQGYTRFREGDILVPKITPTFEADRSTIAIGLRNGFGAGTTELHIVRCSPQADRRYVRFLVSTRPFLKGGEAEMLGVAGQKRVPDNWLRDHPVPVVDVRKQRIIADFLDAETARIDALIAKKRRMIDILEHRKWIAFERRVQREDAVMVPARRVFRSIVDGPFGSAFTADEYVEDGTAVVRLGNIGFAEFRPAELVFLPAWRFDSFRQHAVDKGNVLFAGLGDERNHAGRACVAPDLGRAIVKGKSFCAKIDERRALPDYIAMFFSSPMGRTALAAEARGSTRAMINLEIVKSVEMPLPTPERQAAIVRSSRAEWSLIDKSTRALQRQLRLLQEHRQALITAAVTGDLEIPGWRRGPS